MPTTTATPSLGALFSKWGPDGASIYPPPQNIMDRAHIVGQDKYLEMYARSLADPDAFWGELAAGLYWKTTWTPPVCT